MDEMFVEQKFIDSMVLFLTCRQQSQSNKVQKEWNSVSYTNYRAQFECLVLNIDNCWKYCWLIMMMMLVMIVRIIIIIICTFLATVWS